ncbi:MAG: low temperature requirement protein A [Actinomycetota bacterium]
MTGPSTFRRLWQPPGRYEDRAADRRVTFLELFFDLVFVVVISQLAHRLAEHPPWSGVGWFAFLFYAVWSSWLNGTLYYDLHGTDDVSVRVFTFGQMLAVALIAAYIGDVPGEGSAGFALAYAANTFILVILWFRTGLHDPSHRPGSIPYSTGYLLATMLFVVSAGVDEPARYRLWALALVVEVAGQVIGYHRWTPPATQGGEATIATTPSLIERFGLFVIIVLGEVIVGAVDGMAQIVPLQANEIVLGLLGVLVAVGLWWIYFDLVSHRAPISSRTQLWLYLHLPLVIAMAAGGSRRPQRGGAGHPAPAGRGAMAARRRAGGGGPLGRAHHADARGASRIPRDLSSRGGSDARVGRSHAGRRPDRLGSRGEPHRDGAAVAAAGRGGFTRVAPTHRPEPRGGLLAEPRRPQRQVPLLGKARGHPRREPE